MQHPSALCPTPGAAPISQGSDVTAVQFNFFQPSLPNTILPSSHEGKHSESSSTSSDVHGSTEPSPTTLEASVQTAAPFPAGETEAQAVAPHRRLSSAQGMGDAAWHPALTQHQQPHRAQRSWSRKHPWPKRLIGETRFNPGAPNPTAPGRALHFPSLLKALKCSLLPCAKP